MRLLTLIALDGSLQVSRFFVLRMWIPCSTYLTEMKCHLFINLVRNNENKSYLIGKKNLTDIYIID